MNVATVGLALDERDQVRMWASRSSEEAYLVLETEGSYWEIRLGRVHADALREQLPGVLAGLDRWAAEDARCEAAEIAGRKAVDAAARALDLAMTADRAGAHDLSASLRAAAAEATARSTAVEAGVRAFDDTALAADHAAETLRYVMSEAEAALRRS